MSIDVSVLLTIFLNVCHKGKQNVSDQCIGWVCCISESGDASVVSVHAHFFFLAKICNEASGTITWKEERVDSHTEQRPPLRNNGLTAFIEAPYSQIL